MRQGRILCGVVFATLVGFSGGCGGTPTASLTGKVTYKNEPVAEAVVTIMGSDGMPVAVMTDAAGVYTIPEIKLNSEEYSITVAKTPSIDSETAEVMKRRGQNIENAPPPPRERPTVKPSLPEVYNDFGTTPFKGIKLKKGNNEQDLPL